MLCTTTAWCCEHCPVHLEGGSSPGSFWRSMCGTLYTHTEQTTTMCRYAFALISDTARFYKHRMCSSLCLVGASLLSLLRLRLRRVHHGAVSFPNRMFVRSAMPKRPQQNLGQRLIDSFQYKNIQYTKTHTHTQTDSADDYIVLYPITHPPNN